MLRLRRDISLISAMLRSIDSYHHSTRMVDNTTNYSSAIEKQYSRYSGIAYDKKNGIIIGKRNIRRPLSKY